MAPAIRHRCARHHRLTLEAVLADPDAALGLLSVGQGHPRASLRSHPVPPASPIPSWPPKGLQEGARQLGYTLRVETQGSVGAGNPLTAEEIAQADVVLIAADREVDRSRFAGKRVLVSNTKPAITGGAALIDKALAEAVVEAGAASTGENAEAPPSVQAPTSI
jgi:PTS system fructose-specific IIC component